MADNREYGETPDEEFMRILSTYWFCVKHEESIRKDNECWQCKVDEANIKMDEAVRIKAARENELTAQKNTEKDL